jgi:phosphopantothenoylcysteine decarboxylase/phosphopantothenate--cysteine ligase
METAEDAALEKLAKTKLEKKKVDLVVANEARTAFGGDDNRVLVVGTSGTDTLERASKSKIADGILDRVVALLRAG